MFWLRVSYLFRVLADLNHDQALDIIEYCALQWALSLVAVGKELPETVPQNLLAGKNRNIGKVCIDMGACVPRHDDFPQRR